MMATSNVGSGQNQPTAPRYQTASGRGFELFPYFVGAQNQRHKLAAFAKRLTGDTGLSVRRALIVRRIEAIDADHVSAELRCLVESGASHCPQADHHDVSDDCHAT